MKKDTDHDTNVIILIWLGVIAFVLVGMYCWKNQCTLDNNKAKKVQATQEKRDAIRDRNPRDLSETLPRLMGEPQPCMGIPCAAHPTTVPATLNAGEETNRVIRLVEFEPDEIGTPRIRDQAARCHWLFYGTRRMRRVRQYCPNPDSLQPLDELDLLDAPE